MKKKNISLSQLAQMVQRGFEQTAAKQDFEQLRKDLGQLRGATQEGFGLMHNELAEIKRTLPPLLRAVAAMGI